MEEEEKRRDRRVGAPAASLGLHHVASAPVLKRRGDIHHNDIPRRCVAVVLTISMVNWLSFGGPDNPSILVAQVSPSTPATPP